MKNVIDSLVKFAIIFIKIVIALFCFLGFMGVCRFLFPPYVTPWWTTLYAASVAAYVIYDTHKNHYSKISIIQIAIITLINFTLIYIYKYPIG
jgi:hypothetical protein